jgi:hypothetical protein
MELQALPDFEIAQASEYARVCCLPMASVATKETN